MKLTTGYNKPTFSGVGDDSYLLLAGGGHKAISDFVASNDSKLTDSRYPKFANNTWYLVGDDVNIGDCNVGGCLGIKGNNNLTGIAFYNYNTNTSNYTKLLATNGNANYTLTLPGKTGTIATTGDIPTTLPANGGTADWLNYNTHLIGNKNNYPFHRILYTNSISNSYDDRQGVYIISLGYNGGHVGIFRVTTRTNNVSTKNSDGTGRTPSDSSATIEWLLRKGFAIDAILAGFRNVGGDTYIDVYYKADSSYHSVVVERLQEGGRGTMTKNFTTCNSREVDNTTTTDKLTSTEVYATLAVGTDNIEGRIYTHIITPIDVGNVNYANMAGSATNATYASNVGSSSDYVTAALVKALHTWYTTATDGDTDTLINNWNDIVRFLENTSDETTLLGLLAAKLNKAGGTVTGDLTINGSTTLNAVSASTLTVSGASTFTTPINGDLLGNATTADRLKNSRTINGVAFDGSGDITISATASAVPVRQHTGNNTNYPLVWTNLTAASDSTSNQLFKTAASLYFNTNTFKLTSAGGFLSDGTFTIGSSNDGTSTQSEIKSGSFGALKITRSGSTNGASIAFANSNGTLGFIGMTNAAGGGLQRWNTSATALYTIYDSGNLDVSTLYKFNDIKNNTPVATKTYTGSFYSTNDSWLNSTWYYGSVLPETYYKPWRIKLKITAWCEANAGYRQVGWVEWYGRLQNAMYYNFNDMYNRVVYYGIVRMPYSDWALTTKVGIPVGLSIRYAENWQSSSYPRTFKVEFYSAENCTFKLFDNAVKFADYGGQVTLAEGYSYKGAWSSSTAYAVGDIVYSASANELGRLYRCKAAHTGLSVSNANTYWQLLHNDLTVSDMLNRGLRESGDDSDTANLQVGNTQFIAGTNGIKRYTLCALDSDGRYQSITTTANNTSTGKTANTTAKFVPNGKIYYYTTGNEISNGNRCSTYNMYYCRENAEIRYNTNYTWSDWVVSTNDTTNYPVKDLRGKHTYIECSVDSNGYWSPTSNMLTTTLTAGNYYIYIGVVNNNTNSPSSGKSCSYLTTLVSDNPMYYYDGTNLIPWEQRAYIAWSLTISGNKTFTGNTTINSLTAGTLSVTGTTAIDSLTAGNLTVTGASTLTGDVSLGTVKAGTWNGSSIGASYLPTASTSASGIVQLSSATNSTSTTLAATASAVKAAYDIGNHSHPYLSTSGGTLTGYLHLANNGLYPQLHLDTSWSTNRSAALIYTNTGASGKWGANQLLIFRVYSGDAADSTGASTYYYNFLLPSVPVGLTENKSYTIYTSLNFVAGTHYASAHTHPYLSTGGGTLTGDLTLESTWDSKSIIFKRGTLEDTTVDWRLQVRSGIFYIEKSVKSDSDAAGTTYPNWTSAFYLNSTGTKGYINGSEISVSGHTHTGYASSSHTHSYLPLSGGKITGNVRFANNNYAPRIFLATNWTTSRDTAMIYTDTGNLSGNTWGANQLLIFRVYSGNSSGGNGAGSYCYNFLLPSVPVGLTASSNYTILTSKGGRIGVAAGNAYLSSGSTDASIGLVIGGDVTAAASTKQGAAIAFSRQAILSYWKSTDNSDTTNYTNSLYINPKGGSIYFGGGTVPISNNSILLGWSDRRWSAIYSYYSYATNGFFQSSDIRLKNVLNYLDLQKSYDFLEACRPFNYEFKSNPGEVLLGVSALEVELFYPEIVNTDNEGYKSVQYDKLAVILLEVCKDMNKRLKVLENGTNS